jgi:ferrochelatase
MKFDAAIMIGYGGPEKPEDIMPFLRRVAKGRPIPEERLREVAEHYEIIGGRSPINELTFRQAKGLEGVLAEKGMPMKVYVGMRNWHPLLTDTVKEMARDGVKNVVGIILATCQCYSSWEQYQENFRDAIAEAGVEIGIEYIPPVYNHPLFIDSVAENVAERLREIPLKERKLTRLLFTAHSIPLEMAEGSPYVEQLLEASRLVAGRVDFPDWTLCFQSRSGRPEDPWLEPDVCEVIERLSREGVKHVVVEPIGFVCDHVEVLYDIGVEAQKVADDNGVTLHLARTVNDSRGFLLALADLVEKTVRRG